MNRKFAVAFLYDRDEGFLFFGLNCFIDAAFPLRFACADLLERVFLRQRRTPVITTRAPAISAPMYKRRGLDGV
jgi:hypothetical protein